MSGFGGGFGSSGFGAGGGFGSTTPPPPVPTFGASSMPGGPTTTSAASSTTAIFGSSPDISTTGFGGGGGFTGSFAGSTNHSTMGGFGSTSGSVSGAGGGFGFGSSNTSTSSGAFPSASFNTTSTNGGFGSIPSSSTPSSLGGFGGFGGNSGTSSSAFGMAGPGSSSNDMGFDDATTPTFGNTTTAAPSSFGGGFGTASTFGNAPTSSTGGFGTTGGFGASASTTTATTFGSTPSTLTGFGGGTNGGGFGAPITFGSAPSVSASPAGSFGSNTTMAGGGFGTSTTFGNAPSSSMGGFGTSSTSGGFGVSSSMFGSAPASTPGGFGASSTGNGGFGTSTGGFGGTTTVSGGFGASSTTFGTSTGMAGFGGAPANSTTTSSGTGFGTNTAGMFSSATAPVSDFGTLSSSGFGTAPTMAFGASSNVVTGPSSNQQLRFGQANNTGWHPKPTSNPFAPSTSHDDGMMGDETSPKPDHSNPQSTFSNSNNSNMTFGRPYSQTGFQGPTTNPIPEENEMGEGDDGDEKDVAAAAKQRADEEARLKAKIEEKKRLLQAKIEEKRKKLLEKQRQQREQSTTPEMNSNSGTQDSVPSNKSLAERNAIRFGDQEKSLAERNAIRFGEQDRSTTREMLPPAMRVKAERATPPPVIATDSDQQRSTEREDLKTAKALVGTCENFCPEEELLRREREGDIQQLEIPMPGKLHPAHWTLQQTAVKRFRRSAADYKLDVPEWVRPPDVLEQVCGYLEEWVMERDRQGPDPRFPQGQTPPPLEVYQFIWDRTRMIRKDFTLQNYVGTGGKCDARAVRCHERIARWHAMCEHQLSHIPEFVTMQSQQNIQELGQTMKTLNQFYDDSMNRATVEVPDENGKETRLNLTGFSHGCTSNCVQGQSPLEFDGTELNNADNVAQVAKRIVGKHAVNHPAHGTAEPEMRGLYMLLTMNNEGGMEVLKYAARLFQERPDIYASKPVQLALEIFKAKKEYNYARFFSILRAPTTPYLFCCIMFKHVELMRKIAFRIMSKAFGARKKETGEAIYDAYPLSRLIDLLCFEDLDEARAACNHYNITVKQVQMSASREEVADIIFWRASEFKEPIHPEKGYVLPLQPRKMSRTIEQKLRGATRLAVCRGEVSGEGATLHSVVPSIPFSNIPQSNTSILPERLKVPVNETTSEDDQAKAAMLLERQKLEASKREQEALLREQERLRHESEEKKKEEERLQQETKEKQAKEIEKQRVLRELELKKQEAEKLKEQRKKEELEKEALAERLREEAKRREVEAEANRRQKEAQKKAEEEWRAAEEKRRRDEDARKETERLERIAEQQRRLEEAQRQALLRRELERKREQEAEEKRKANEWEEKVNAARRLVLWKRWQNRIMRSIVMTKGSVASLEQLDPTFLSHTLKLGSWFENVRMVRSEHDTDELLQTDSRDIRRAIDACVRGKSPRIPLSRIVVSEMAASQHVLRIASTDNFEGVNTDTKTTLLLKVALLIPSVEGNDSQAFLDLLKDWIHARIGLNEISTEESQSNVSSTSFEARSIVRHCRNADDSSDCDVALVLVPPPWSTSDERRRGLSAIRSMVDDSIPRVALVLGEFDHEGHEYMKSVLAETLGTPKGTIPIVCNRNATPMALEKALEISCRKLAKMFVDESCIKVDRISVARLVSRAVSMGLWTSTVSSQPVVDGNVVLETARNAISAFIKSANTQVIENEGVWSLWPSREFISENGVDSYFSSGAHLPRDWISSLSRQNLDQELSWMARRLTGSFRDVVESFLLDAPTEIREECEVLVSKGYYRRGLQAAMHWFSFHAQSDKTLNSYIYFPRGLMEVIFDELELPDPGNGNKNPTPALLLPQDNILLDTIEEIDQTMKKATGLKPHIDSNDISILANVYGNKRRHPDPTSTERSHSGIESPSTRSDLVETKKFRSSGKLQLNSKVDMEESAAFSKRLQELMMGATVELEVGDNYLSNILHNAPQISNHL